MKKAEISGDEDKRRFDQHDPGVIGVQVSDDTARIWRQLEELDLISSMQLRYGPEVLSGEGVETLAAGLGMSHVLEDDAIFEDALLNPVANALARLVVGNKALVNSSVAILKWAGDKELTLHCDATAVPSPFAPICPGINMTWH